MAPPPSRLAIATASVHRLLKEEASYRTELRSQEARLTRLQQGAEDDTDNDNREWEIGQETDEGQRRAIEETKAVFGPLREKVLAAVEALEGMLMTSEGDESGEVTAAREAIEKAKAGDEGGGASV
ncbi:MAG: hypothetical protein LQ351_000921 [Letrouitia transgressa]|nr:MAG: hypothetical protein LQ351_000921 [Letrouitia transgressa]